MCIRDRVLPVQARHLRSDLRGGRVTIGSDQLDAWTTTLAEADMLYREIQLLTRINPEAYTVNSDAITITAIANADAWDDAGLVHPVAFARYWAWHLAAENKSIPPITNNWVTLIRYVSAHLQYLGRDDRDWFADELRRLRGLLGALVNEHGLAQGEEDALSALNAHAARKALRQWALTSNRTMKRKDLAKAFPTLTDNDWHALRMRKVRSSEDIPAYHYPVKWVAEIAPEDNAPIPMTAQTEAHRDAMADRSLLQSLDNLDPDTVYLDTESRTLVLADKGKRKTQEAPEEL